MADVTPVTTVLNDPGLTKVLAEINTLKSGAMWFILALAVIGLVGYRMWLTSRSKTEDKKTKRAEAYTGAMEGVRAALETQSTLLRQLVINSGKGAMNTEDSIRLIEERFENVIKKEIVRVAVASIERNHYDSEPENVQLVALEKFNSIIYLVWKDIRQYTTAFNPDVFFAKVSHNYSLALDCWDQLSKVHEKKLRALADRKRKRADDDTDVIVASFSKQAEVLMQQAVNNAFNAAKDRALDIYDAGLGTGRPPSADGLAPSSRRYPSESAIPAQ